MKAKNQQNMKQKPKHSEGCCDSGKHLVTLHVTGIRKQSTTAGECPVTRENHEKENRTSAKRVVKGNKIALFSILETRRQPKTVVIAENPLPPTRSLEARFFFFFSEEDVSETYL